MEGWTIAELAQAFDVGATTMWRWTRRPGFPPSLGYRLQRGLHDRFDVREPRGRSPEIWDLGRVQGWRAEQIAATWTARVERERAAARSRRQLEADRIDDLIRRHCSNGQPLRTIAATVNVPYSRVRRVTVGLARPAAYRPDRPYRYTDTDIVAALRACAPATISAYETWRHHQPATQPASATIISRYGTWAAAQAVGV